MNEIIVRRDGLEIGRYTRPNLIRFVRAGRICASDEISSDGGSTWQGVAISAFASYAVTSAPPTTSVGPQRTERVRQSSSSDQPPLPSMDWAPFQRAMVSFARFVRSPLGVVLMAGVMLLLVVVAGISAWKWMTPLSAEERVISDWLDQYRKTGEMLEEFSTAVKRGKPADEARLVLSYAEKLQIQAQLLGSLALDAKLPSQRQDWELYAVAVNDLAVSMEAIVRLDKRKADQESDAALNVLAGIFIGLGTDDAEPVLSAVGSSLAEANALSGAEKQAADNLQTATRNYKGADNIIRVKYLE